MWEVCSSDPRESDVFRKVSDVALMSIDADGKLQMTGNVCMEVGRTISLEC